MTLAYCLLCRCTRARVGERERVRVHARTFQEARHVYSITAISTNGPILWEAICMIVFSGPETYQSKLSSYRNQVTGPLLPVARLLWSQRD